jgi:NADH-quinone oxidoreductase subunit I
MAAKIKVYSGIKNLIIGLGVTIRHLFSHAVTLQYPDERWEMPERSRGVVVLLSDKETGDLNCTACILCAKACPVGAIWIERHRGDDKRWKLDKFEIDNTICCYCGLCEEACNFDAIKLTGKYEFSAFDKESLTYDVNRLQELGLDVDYEPKRKKPAPKPAATPQPKPATDASAGEAKAESAAAANPEAAGKSPEVAEKKEQPGDSAPAAETKPDDNNEEKGA